LALSRFVNNVYEMLTTRANAAIVHSRFVNFDLIRHFHEFREEWQFAGQIEVGNE